MQYRILLHWLLIGNRFFTGATGTLPTWEFYGISKVRTHFLAPSQTVVANVAGILPSSFALLSSIPLRSGLVGFFRKDGYHNKKKLAM
jgi:hypothetical protein